MASQGLGGAVKVLLVEDNARFAEDLRESLTRRIQGLNLEVARNLVEAMHALDSNDHDLIVCDLRIPYEASSTTEEVEHGRAVYERAREDALGTPIIVFSA